MKMSEVLKLRKLMESGLTREEAVAKIFSDRKKVFEVLELAYNRK